MKDNLRENMQSKKSRLSVVLATFNEAENIGRCLEAVKDIAFEIIVVDGDSTDNTRKIARSLGARIIKTTNKPNFHINKQMAMNEAVGEWVLQLDADEVVDGEMKQAIGDILQQGSDYNAFYLKRKNFFLGRFLTKGGQYPDMVIRLYTNGKAQLPQQDVHEQMEVTGEVGILSGHLEHFNAPSFKRYITNANRYTSLTAASMQQSQVKLSFRNDFIYLIWLPKVTFLKLYFRHKGYQDGFPGFVFALFSGLHHALSYMKLGDLKRNESRH